MGPETGAVSVNSPGRSVSVGGSRAFALSSLRQISELTGGQAAIHKDIGAALERVDEATRAEYRLGYYPDDAAWDGTYRDIVVKVNRPGVKTTHRHGYFARDSLEPYNRRDFAAYSRISAAAAYPSEVRDLPFKVTLARQKDAAGKPELRVDLKINASKIGFKAENDRHSGTLQIAVFVAGPQDKNLGNDWQTINMDLGEESYQKALRDGVPYSTSIPLRYNVEVLKIVVYDLGGDKVGSTVRQLR